MPYYDDEMTDLAVERFARWFDSQHNKAGGIWDQPARGDTERVGDKIYIRGGAGVEDDGSRKVLAVYRVVDARDGETVRKLRK